MSAQKQNDATGANRGFTLIELLVVVAVIGFMLAMILPAVLTSYYRARRVQCANNMRQAVVALHNYHDMHGSLPPAWICDRRDASGPQWGWAALVLPMLEQQFLYKTLQPGPSTIADNLAMGTAVAHPLSNSLSTLTCPEDRVDNPELSRPFLQTAGMPAGWQVGKSSYVANVGFFYRTADYENNGVMYGNSALPLRAVTDGTSCTIMLGERDQVGGAATWVGIANPQNPGANGFGWVGGVVSVPMNCPLVKGYRDCGFSSQHEGGSHFAFCDGSVRFLSEHISFSNGSANPLDSTSDTLLTKSQKMELGVYQCLGIRDDNRPLSKCP